MKTYKDRNNDLVNLSENEFYAARNNTSHLSVKADEIIPLQVYQKSSDEYAADFVITADWCVQVNKTGIIFVSASVQLFNAGNDYKIVCLRRVRADVNDMIASSAGFGTNFNVSIPVVPVSCKAGDKLYLCVTTDSTLNISSGGGYRTYMLFKG